MENEKLQDVAMQIIASAGSCKGLAYEAISLAKDAQLNQAANKLNEAKQLMTEAHNAHFKLLQLEADGQIDSIGVLTTHSQDHFMGSILAFEIANEFINVYKELNDLRERVRQEGGK